MRPPSISRVRRHHQHPAGAGDIAGAGRRSFATLHPGKACRRRSRVGTRAPAGCTQLASTRLPARTSRLRIPKASPSGQDGPAGGWNSRAPQRAGPEHLFAISILIVRHGTPRRADGCLAYDCCAECLCDNELLWTRTILDLTETHRGAHVRRSRRVHSRAGTGTVRGSRQMRESVSSQTDARRRLGGAPPSAGACTGGPRLLLSRGHSRPCVLPWQG